MKQWEGQEGLVEQGQLPPKSPVPCSLRTSPPSPSWSLPKLTSSHASFSPSLCLLYRLTPRRSTPYDSYEDSPGGRPAAGGSAGEGAKPGNTKTAQIQQQIDDTVGIMRENITKVAERGERLDALQDKTGAFS
jgi:hypothetical protein